MNTRTAMSLFSNYRRNGMGNGTVSSPQSAGSFPASLDNLDPLAELRRLSPEDLKSKLEALQKELSEESRRFQEQKDEATYRMRLADLVVQMRKIENVIRSIQQQQSKVD